MLAEETYLFDDQGAFILDENGEIIKTGRINIIINAEMENIGSMPLILFDGYISFLDSIFCVDHPDFLSDAKLFIENFGERPKMISLTPAGE